MLDGNYQTTFPVSRFCIWLNISDETSLQSWDMPQSDVLSLHIFGDMPPPPKPSTLTKDNQGTEDGAQKAKSRKRNGRLTTARRLASITATIP